MQKRLISFLLSVNFFFKFMQIYVIAVYVSSINSSLMSM